MEAIWKYIKNNPIIEDGYCTPLRSYISNTLYDGENLIVGNDY